MTQVRECALVRELHNFECVCLALSELTLLLVVVVVVVSGDEHVRAINSDLSERQSKSERAGLVVALYSTVLEYVHRRVSLSLCCSGSFGLANRATMLLARVNGEQEISLQPVAQV